MLFSSVMLVQVEAV